MERETKKNISFRRLLLILISVAFLLHGFRLPGAAQVMVYHSVPTESMKVALTFDDGPHPSQTHRILEILERYHVRATFFMIGVNVANYPDAAREVISRGHEIGNHTYSHSHLKKMDEGALDQELKECEETLKRICDYRPHLFRPPEGVLNSYVRHCSERGDYTLILWSVDTRDWETKNADMIADRVLSNIQPGSIILMHDYVAQSKTPEALEILLPKILALGYEPVTVNELIGNG